ncbi:hypothetical protein K439DRAFT_604031 [Ramaria rubella]|nr:hypothetical protein K439DRAFT_604031 [Ramaria rubella]
MDTIVIIIFKYIPSDFATLPIIITYIICHGILNPRRPFLVRIIECFGSSLFTASPAMRARGATYPGSLFSRASQALKTFRSIRLRILLTCAICWWSTDPGSTHLRLRDFSIGFFVSITGNLVRSCLISRLICWFE